MPADIDKKIKPVRVIDRVIEADVAPLITIVCTNSNPVFEVLYFLYVFFEFWLLSLVYAIFFYYC